MIRSFYTCGDRLRAHEIVQAVGKQCKAEDEGAGKRESLEVSLSFGVRS